MAKLQLPELEIKLNDAQINSLVQQYIAQTYRESDIQNRIYCYATQRISRRIDQMINDGTLLDEIAKRLAKTIPMDKLIPLIDKDRLNEIVAERITKHLINKAFI